MNSAPLLERPPATAISTEPEVPSASGSAFSMERILLATGLLAAALGTGLFLHTAVTADPAVALETTANNGQLAARLDYYEWLEHNHANHDHSEDEEGEVDGDVVLNAQAEAEGFARPASMMPGTPDEGFQRLQIELHMQNTQGAPTEVYPGLFWLEDGDGGSWSSLRGGTFRPTVLGSGHALNTVLAFDVEDDRADADMELVWLWGGEEIRFAVTGSDHH